MSSFAMSSKSQSGQSRATSGSSSGRNRAVESAVTRLLVSIKQLLEALTNWSLLKIDENEVSDVYVRLGNDFNQAVAAFASFNIDMSELMTVPDDLRNVLEQCLAEDATPENLELYLPHVRQIITGLLQGLREKQSIYSKMTRRGSENTNHERTESRSSRGDRPSRKPESTHRPQGSRTVSDSDRADREGSDREGVRRSTHASSSRRKNVASGHSRVATDDGEFVGGFATPRSDAPRLGGLPFEEENPAPAPASPFDGARKHRTHPSMAESTGSPSPMSTPQSAPPPQLPPPDVPLPAPPAQPAVPASVKRYSLVDKPMPPTSPPPKSPPPVIVEPASPPPEPTSTQTSPAIEQPAEVTPAMASSLAALQKNDLLERRASKRFSTFHISKMTGGSGATRERSLRGHPHRRSLAAGSALTPGDLAVLAEDEEEGEQPKEQEGSKRERERSISRTATPDPTAPPVPKLPPQFKESASETTLAHGTTPPQPSGDPSKITVFLQVGREVKKAVVERNISLGSLRILFVDKFGYNPGRGDFPAVYIRDPSSGVQYELEDVEEISEKCLLILNIEPLDQIKEHIDTQISALSNDIKELRSAVSNARYSQPALPSIVTQIAESAPVNQPSERQFVTAARRLSRFVSPAMHERSHSPSTPTAAEFPSSPIHTQMTGQSLQPQSTGGSVLSEYSSRIVTDLKTQFDEVQNLRRDIGVMRQLYTGFMKQTKDSLGALRKQTQSVKQLATTEIGGARNFIVTGKKKLDERTQNVLTDIEKLLDTVEAMRDDVLKRQMTPKEFVFKNMKRELDKAHTELESLREHIKTIKPMWKKTWEEELQNIVEEQQFLTHQEQFLEDLIEDHKAAEEIYGHLEKVINLRGPKLNGTGKNRPIPRQKSFPGGNAEGGPGSISNVMMEIRAAAGDSEKRMEAIKASEQNREKELATRSDDLQAELTEFVGQKKLKMTGGAEEADRVRQKRSEATLRAMFNGPSSVASTPISEMPRTPPST